MAAAEDDVDLIHSIVTGGTLGVRPDAEEPLHKMTAMHFAARRGHVKAIMALANLGASVNAPDADLNVPLRLAVENLHRDAAMALKGLGATLEGEHRNKAHTSIVRSRVANRLRELATRNDRRKFIMYLEVGADPNHLHDGGKHDSAKNIRSGSGSGGSGGGGGGTVFSSVLHSAVAHGGLEVVRALVDAGANLNCPDHRGFTPLFTALDVGADKSVVRLLRQRGATLVVAAAAKDVVPGERKHGGLVTWLANYVNDLIEEKETDKARYFIECGVNMNCKAGYEQRTPVHMAATVAGCEELLDWMLRNGGDPNKTNRKGYTALAEAIETGCVEASKVLKKHGALLGGPDTIKLLSTACVMGDLQGVLAILGTAGNKSGGIDVNTPMPGNRTVLHQAAEGGHHGIIRALSRVGADIFAEDGHGATPLATAMLQRRWLAALELMRCGAAPRVRVCETEGAFLRALRIAKEAGIKLVAVYWCGGNLPALSDKFIEAADSRRADEARGRFSHHTTLTLESRLFDTVCFMYYHQNPCSSEPRVMYTCDICVLYIPIQ